MIELTGFTAGKDDPFTKVVSWYKRRYLPCPYVQPGWRPVRDIGIRYVTGSGIETRRLNG